MLQAMQERRENRACLHLLTGTERKWAVNRQAVKTAIYKGPGEEKWARATTENYTSLAASFVVLTFQGLEIVNVFKTEKAWDTLRENWSKQIQITVIQTEDSREEEGMSDSKQSWPRKAEELWRNADIVLGQMGSHEQDWGNWLGNVAFSLEKEAVMEGEEWRSVYPVAVRTAGVKVLTSHTSPQ